MITALDAQEAAFIEAVRTWTRAEKLKLLRAAGLTAHQIKSDEDLTDAIVQLRRRNLRTTTTSEQGG